MKIHTKIKEQQRLEYGKALREQLEATHGDVRATARNLGVSREWVRRWTKRLGIDVSEYRRERSYKILLHGRLLGDVLAHDEDRAKAKAVVQFHILPTDLGGVMVLQDPV